MGTLDHKKAKQDVADIFNEIVSIQLTSPASGNYTANDVYGTVFELVSIQLTSPASGN